MNTIKALLLVSIIALTACELPDVKGMNKMPKQTQEMGVDIKITNENMRKLKLKEALAELDKEENQRTIMPVPTGLMPWGKTLAETATPIELLELTRNWIGFIEDVVPAHSGFNADFDVIKLTEAEIAKVRMEKIARFYTAMIVAGFAQEEKIDQIIANEIYGEGTEQATALKFLALRAFFLREVMLKTVMKIDSSSPQTLSTSGMMNKALGYLVKLNRISTLPFADAVAFDITDRTQYQVLSFQDSQNAEGRKQTADIWRVALEKAVAGQQIYTEQTAVSLNSLGTTRDQELARQNAAIQTMKSYNKSWESKLK